MKQILVPVTILCLLAGLLFPLPASVIDYLLVINITLALLFLVSSLYINDPLKLSALPSFLLLATLFRLTLNVSTTRLLLSTGDPGQVVQAFGHVVVQDSLLVGFIIFLIISFIQLIVIAKGSERVAEVSARFTLDALPGKQMSIDADMRSGLIDFNEARSKRQNLQVESRFYGALDGAMKFIKGDAITGLIITGINIIGGLIIGVAINALPLQTALAHYTLLTVGDGLLSQIPALLNSVAAGIVVTRVVQNENSNLASDLFSQLFALRSVKIIIGLTAVTLSVLPDIPTLPFLTIGFLLLVLSGKNFTQSLEKEEDFQFKPQAPALLEINFTKDLHNKFSFQEIQACIEKFRTHVFQEIGLILAQPEIRFTASENNVEVKIRGILVQRITLSSVNDLEYLQKELFQSVYINRLDFIDDIQTRRILDQQEKYAPELIAQVVPDIASVTKITGILKELLKENVSIVNFDSIIQAIAEAGSKSSSERMMLEEVRIALKRFISFQYTNEDRSISAVTIDTEIDLNFFKAEREGSQFNIAFLEAVISKVKEIDSESQRIVLLTSQGARKIIKECLEQQGLNIPVLAYEEVNRDLKIISVAHVSSESTDFEDKQLFTQTGIN